MEVDIAALTGISGSVIVMALVQALKTAFGIPGRYVQLLCILIGIAWSALLYAAAGDLSATAVIIGVLTGLAATGTYEGGTKLLAGDSDADAVRRRILEPPQ